MLDQKDLKCLIEIIDEGGFEAGAKVLNLTTGAVSQRIRRLESMVGMQLVVRGRPPHLTETGEQIMSFARRIWLLQNEMDRSIALDRDPRATIPVAVNHDSLACWFLEAVKSFTKEVGLFVDVKTSNSEETHELFVAGHVLATVTSNPKPVPGCKVRYIGTIQYMAVCSQDFAATYFPSGVDANSLRNAPAVYYDRQDSVSSPLLKAYGLNPNNVQRHYLPGTAELYRATAIGMGWSTMPVPYLEMHSNAPQFITLQPASIPVKLYWKTWDMTSKEIATLDSHVVQTAKRLLVDS